MSWRTIPLLASGALITWLAVGAVTQWWTPLVVWACIFVVYLVGAEDMYSACLKVQDERRKGLV
jgi:uncharacterized membrane protein